MHSPKNRMSLTLAAGSRPRNSSVMPTCAEALSKLTQSCGVSHLLLRPLAKKCPSSSRLLAMVIFLESPRVQSAYWWLVGNKGIYSLTYPLYNIFPNSLLTPSKSQAHRADCSWVSTRFLGSGRQWNLPALLAQLPLTKSVY